jgi:hypothetical protein
MFNDTTKRFQQHNFLVLQIQKILIVSQLPVYYKERIKKIREAKPVAIKKMC